MADADDLSQQPEETAPPSFGVCKLPGWVCEAACLRRDRSTQASRGRLCWGRLLLPNNKIGGVLPSLLRSRGALRGDLRGARGTGNMKFFSFSCASKRRPRPFEPRDTPPPDERCCIGTAHWLCGITPRLGHTFGST